MTDFLHTDARWTEHFVEVSDPHKEGHHVRFYFEPPHKEQIAKLTEMLQIQQKLHETAVDMLRPAVDAAYQKGYADAMGWKTQNHLEHLPPQEKNNA
jgi:hypothetical protein